MSTRSFIVLAVSLIAAGGILGGLFIGGYELGKRRAPDQTAATVDPAMLPSPGGGAALGAGGDMDTATLSDLRQALGSGQMPGNLGRGGGGFGLAGAMGAMGGGVFGTVEGVEGNVVTLSTPQGELRVTLAEQTEIQGIAELEPEDLAAGRSVTVSGEPGEGGAMTATSVFVLPEGMEGMGMFGRGAGNLGRGGGLTPDDVAGLGGGLTLDDLAGLGDDVTMDVTVLEGDAAIEFLSDMAEESEGE